MLGDTLFVNSAIRIALTTDRISEYSDYYCHFDDLATVFSNNSRDLFLEMKASIINHTSDTVALNLFKSNGFSYSDSLYLFKPRLFLIHLDSLDYHYPCKVARLEFS